MAVDPHSFFATLLTAGAILSGFCGTFLAFRIQREANYYRQPALSFEQGKARDISIDLTHFTGAFLLLILATLCAVIFGFMLPLFAIAGSSWVRQSPELAVAGLVATQILLIGYFAAEIRHYGILRSKLINDRKEWLDQKSTVVASILAAALGGLLAYSFFGA